MDPGEPAALEQQIIQYPSLKQALQLDWSALHPRRTHKLLCILAGILPAQFACSLFLSPVVGAQNKFAHDHV